MDKPARVEMFVSDFSGERRLGRFWIAGSLETLMRRALRDGAAEGREPTGMGMALMTAIAVTAIAFVGGLL